MSRKCFHFPFQKPKHNFFLVIFVKLFFLKRTCFNLSLLSSFFVSPSNFVPLSLSSHQDVKRKDGNVTNRIEWEAVCEKL